jgi:hypothetical protein
LHHDCYHQEFVLLCEQQIHDQQHPHFDCDLPENDIDFNTNDTWNTVNEWSLKKRWSYDDEFTKWKTQCTSRPSNVMMMSYQKLCNSHLSTVS